MTNLPAADRRINWQISDDKKTARVSINDDSGCLADIVLTPQAVSAAIAGLAQLRALMDPMVPLDFPLGQQMEGVVDPRWYTEIEGLTGLTTLCLRSPGLGWLAFLMPPTEIERLSAIWAAQQEHRATLPPPGPAN